MSLLYKCDFCGDITDQLAAQVNFRFKKEEDIPLTLTGQRVVDYIASMNVIDQQKDCCSDCVKKFFMTPPTKISIKTVDPGEHNESMDK